jgi:hypothetical protein
MKRIKYIKYGAMLGIGVILSASTQSCSSDQVEENKSVMEQVDRHLGDVSELKKEIDEKKEKMSSQQLSGTFSGTMDGESFEFSEWDSQNSRVSFLDFSAIITARINQNPQEELTIKLLANKWYDRVTPFDLPASTFVMDGSERLEVIYFKEDENGEYIERFQSGEGKMTAKQFDDEHVRISFEGEGFVGDPRKQERVPLIFEIELDYNFISSDHRDKK